MLWTFVVSVWLQTASEKELALRELAQRLSLPEHASIEMMRTVSLESLGGQWTFRVREENRSPSSTMIENKTMRIDQIEAVRLSADGDRFGILVHYRGHSALQLHDGRMKNLQAAWFGGLYKPGAERAMQILERWVLP